MGRNARRRATRRFVTRPSLALLKLEQTIARDRNRKVMLERLERAKADKPWKDPAEQGRPRYPGVNRARAQRRAYRGGLQAMGSAA